MKCVKGECPQTGKDPQITVSIVDQASGSLWGFYCNYECALKDMGGALLHLKDGGDMASVPEPKLEGEDAQPDPVAVQPSMIVNVGTLNPAVEAAPPAPNLLTELDESWHPNQKYLNELAISVANTLGCAAQGQAVEKTDNGKIQAVYLSYGASMKLVNSSVLIDLGNEDYDMLLDPTVFTLNDALKHAVPHIKSVVKQQKANATTSPF